MGKKKAKKIKKLYEVANTKYATVIKARESWAMFSMLSEFIEATERMAEVGPNVAIFGSARTKPSDPYYKQCQELSKRLSDAGFSVTSGGGPGIMEAANRGAIVGKSFAVGLNIELPYEQTANRWQDISLNFRHFFARKVAFVKYADAFILFPGGFGTLDEMSEVLTLIQTRKIKRMPFILVGEEFWSDFMKWVKKTLLGEKLISPEDLDLIQVIDDNDKILDAIFSFYEGRSTDPSEEERQKMLYL